MTKISQYPEISAPDVDDLLIGTDVENSNATKNFTVQSIIDLKPTPTLQQVVTANNSITVPSGTAKAINITLANNSTLYQNGVVVTVPQQTGVYPTYNPAPDAFMAILNGQNPGTLTGSPVGFLADATGADNYGFLADLRTGASTSVGCEIRSFDSHTGNLYTGAKYINDVRSDVFKVDNDGDTTAKSFIKTGGTSTQYLMADGTVSVGGSEITKVLKTTITSAQVLQLFTTPVTILNSSNPLTVAYPISVYVKRNIGDPYTLASSSFSVINDFGTTMSANLNPNPLGNTEGYFQSAISLSQNLSGSGAYKNVLYKLKANTGDPTLGTGDLDVYVTYVEITL